MTTSIIKLPALSQEIEIAPDWIQTRNEIVAAAAEIKTVADDASFRAAGELLRRITKTSNAMEAFRKQYAEPYAEAAKTIKSAADAAREPLEATKRRIQDALNRYAAEQQRIAEAQRKQAEEEQRRAIEKQLAEQQKAQAEADALGLDEPAPVEPVAPVVAAPIVQAPRSDAVRVQEDLAWTVTNPDAVDRAFLVVDPTKVNAYMRQKKEFFMAQIKESPDAGKTLVAGLTLEIKTKVMSR